MAGYGTALLGGVGALRLVDFPELARWTGRGVARTALSEGMAWYWACYIILIVVAYLTNPSDTNFRTFLTDLSFHQHLRRLRSPDPNPLVPAKSVDGEDARARRHGGRDGHVLTFSNRIAISFRTPPYVRRDFGVFCTVSMSDAVSPGPAATKGAEELEEGVAEDGKLRPASGFGTRRAFFVGAFGRWWTFNDGMSIDPTPPPKPPVTAGSETTIVEPAVDAKEPDSPIPSPTAEENDYVPTEGKLPIHRPTRPANSKIIPRAIRPGQKRSGGQPVGPTTLSDLRARAKIAARAQETAQPAAAANPDSAAPANQEGFLSTQAGPGLPFHVSASQSPDPAFHEPAPTANATTTTSNTTTTPGSPDLRSALVLVASQQPSSDPVIRDLRNQVEEAQTSSAATESRLQSELDELKARKRDEEASRQDLRARTRTLEDGKRAADVERLAAEKKLVGSKAERNLLTARIEKAKREMARLKQRQGDAVKSVGKGLAEAKDEEQRLEKEVEEKKAEVRELEAGLAEERARRVELQKRLEARKEDLTQRRQSIAVRRAKLVAEAEARQLQQQRQGFAYPPPTAPRAALQQTQTSPAPASSSLPRVWAPPGSVQPEQAHPGFDAWEPDSILSYHQPPPLEDEVEPVQRPTTPTYEPAPLGNGVAEHRRSTAGDLDDAFAAFRTPGRFGSSPLSALAVPAPSSAEPGRPEAVGMAYDAPGRLEPLMQSPVTPHQTSLIPSGLFSMLDESGSVGGSPALDRSHPGHPLGAAFSSSRPNWSGSAEEEEANADFLALNPSAKSFHSIQPPPSTRKPRGGGPFDGPPSTGIGKVFVDEAEPFKSPWAGVFGPIGHPSSSTSGSAAGQESAGPAGGSRMKALFNRSREGAGSG